MAEGIDVRFIPPDEVGPIDQVWRCPLCGFEMGMGPPGKLISPKCGARHPLTEMEQVLGFTPSREGGDADWQADR